MNVGEEVGYDLQIAMNPPPRRRKCCDLWEEVREWLYSNPILRDRERITPLFNEHWSIRSQLIIGNSCIVIFSTALMLTVCLGLIYSLGNSTQNSLKTSIQLQTESEMLQNVILISEAVERQLEVISNSIVLHLTLQAANYVNRTKIKADGTYQIPRAVQDSFKEYNFVEGCIALGKCPTDYEDLSSRFRVTSGIKGSMKSSSIQLYQSETQQSITTDADWIYAMNQSIFGHVLRLIVNTSSALDSDFVLMNNYGPNSTIFFYTAFSVSTISHRNLYFSLRRTYPGICLNDSAYDSSMRPWFQNSFENAMYIYGPYIETFSKELVLTISSKKIVILDNLEISVVGASNINMNALSKITQSFSFLSGGFAALIKKDTMEVISWKNSTPFDFKKNSFKKLSDLDSHLYEKISITNVSRSGIFSYSKDSAMMHYCAHSPIFTTYDAQTGKSTHSFILLIISQESEVLQSLSDLTYQISFTSSRLALILVVGFVCVFIFTQLATIQIAVAVSKPLNSLQEKTDQISSCTIAQTPDFSQILVESYVDQQGDEISLLNSSIRRLLSKLTLANKRLKTSMYPANRYFESSQKPWNHFASSCDSKTGHEGSIRLSGDLGSLETESNFSGMLHEQLPEVQSHSNENSISNRISRLFTFSARKRFFLNNFTLIILFFSIGFACIAVFQRESSTWVIELGDYLKREKTVHLARFSFIKAEIIASFFEEQYLNGLILSNFAQNVFSEVMTLPNVFQETYSLDMMNPFNFNFSGSSDKFSGYFSFHHGGCSASPGKCLDFHNSNERKLQSLFDLKFPAFFHPFHSLEFIQTGLESTSFTEYYPYTLKPYGTPKSCLIDDTTSAACQSLYRMCNSGSFPYYDVRCRHWYQQANNFSLQNTVKFLSPRISSAGSIVITAVSPVFINASFYGSISLNILASTISNSINRAAILQNGYCFLISTNSPYNVLFHPNLGNCSTLSCVEKNFTTKEYEILISNFLGSLQNMNSSSFGFQKNKESWVAFSTNILLEYAEYSVVVFVPLNDIILPINIAQNVITTSIFTIINVFSGILFFISFLLFAFSQKVTKMTFSPMNNLRIVCEEIMENNLDSQIPHSCSSYEMKILLDSFRSMMISLRFASVSYAKGDVLKAQAIYREALKHFISRGNIRGIGIAQNNLGGVSLSLRDFEKAKFYYEASIDNAQQILSSVPSSDLELKAAALEMVSHRIGNLALVKMEEGDYAGALKLLEQALLIDQEQGHTYGWFIKQGVLGHLYLKQNELEEAKAVFLSVCHFVQSSCDEKFANERKLSWTAEEMSIGSQICTYNLASYFHHTGELPQAEELYIKSLTVSKYIDILYIKKSLIALISIYQTKGKQEDLLGIQRLISEFQLNLNIKLKKKRLLFAVDHSGSMNGSKIEATVSSLLMMFDNIIHEDDEMMLLHFNKFVHLDFMFSKKLDQSKTMRQKIEDLATKPSGGTALYDVILFCIRELRNSGCETSNVCSNWIVLLTDGDDTESKYDASVVQSYLKSSRLHVEGLIIIGIGKDVQVNILESIAKLTPKGCFLFANEDRFSISQAFEHAIQLVEAPIVVEEF